MLFEKFVGFFTNFSKIKQGIQIFCCLHRSDSKRSGQKSMSECEKYLNYNIPENLLLTKFRATSAKLKHLLRQR